MSCCKKHVSLFILIKDLRPFCVLGICKHNLYNIPLGNFQMTWNELLAAEVGQVVAFCTRLVKQTKLWPKNQ